MNKYFFILSLTFVSLISNAQGDIKSEIVKPIKSEAFDNLKLAYELAEYGYKNNSALALIQSAEILTKYPPDPENKSVKIESSTQVMAAKKTTDTNLFARFHPEKLLEDAKSKAGSNKLVTDLIAQINVDGKSRGRVYGPTRVNRSVLANSSYTDYILFEGGEYAEVGILGDGDTDLDLYVYDENGNLIGKDDDYTDNCFVSFTPRWRGSFKIVVVNRGSVYNNYILLSN